VRLGTYYRYRILKKLGLTEIIRAIDNWLDIGCYDGFMLLSIEAKRKVGIDLAPKNQEPLDMIRATAEYLPFKAEKFKVITAFDIIEHIKEDALLIYGIARNLMKNGMLILTTPHKDARVFPRFLKNWLIYQRWGHIREGYSRKSLINLFKEEWHVTFIKWNTAVSNVLYFPLQLLWKLVPKFAKEIINKVIEIEFIRTRKSSTNHSHIILIAKKL